MSVRATKYRDIGTYIWRFEFKLQDMWIGLYWTRDKKAEAFDVWICFIPCFPLHIMKWR